MLKQTLNDPHADVTEWIQEHLDFLSGWVSSYIIANDLDAQAQELWETELCEHCGQKIESDEPQGDFDYWHSYGDNVDLNIFTQGDDVLHCTAYPVVNGMVETDSKYAVSIPLVFADSEVK